MGKGYYVDQRGTRLPSVTGITGKNLGWSKDALMGWVAKAVRQGRDFNQEREESAQVGNAVHKIVKLFFENSDQLDGDWGAVERVMRTIIFTILPEVADWNHKKVINACTSFAAWYLAHPITVVAIEEPLVCEQLGFGGTPDLVCRDQHGSLIILDWKTGKFVYPEYAIQLAAYGFAWRAKTGERVDHLLDIRLDTEEPLWEDHLLEDEARTAAEHVFGSLIEIEGMRSIVESGMSLIDSGRAA